LASTLPIFRGPTLNDLYYPNAGNPTLAPEQGRAYEFGLQLNSNKNKAWWEASFKPFVYKYQYFIAWFPAGNVWTPQPREQAAASGITVLVRYGLRIQKVEFSVRQHTTYVQGGYRGSALTITRRPEVFIYAPSWRSVTGFSMKVNMFNFLYQASYTGKRYIDTKAQSPALQPFTIHTVNVEYENIRVLKGFLGVSLQASCASKKTYAFMANYAAPAYWGQVSCTYQFGYGK